MLRGISAARAPHSVFFQQDVLDANDVSVRVTPCEIDRPGANALTVSDLGFVCEVRW